MNGGGGGGGGSPSFRPSEEKEEKEEEGAIEELDDNGFRGIRRLFRYRSVLTIEVFLFLVSVWELEYRATFFKSCFLDGQCNASPSQKWRRASLFFSSCPSYGNPSRKRRMEDGGGP